MYVYVCIHTLFFVGDDRVKLFAWTSGQEEYRDKRRFLYGESMGGAVALLIHRKDPAFWHGAVLVAPMCKVRDAILTCYHNNVTERQFN